VPVLLGVLHFPGKVVLMNWKRIAHSAVCLLVVLTILLNCVPVKAEAVVVGGGVGAFAISLLDKAGWIFSPRVVEDIIAIGNSLSNYLRDWGVKNGLTDDVNLFLSSLSVLDDLVDLELSDCRIFMSSPIASAVACWIFGVLQSGISIDQTEKLEAFSCSNIYSPEQNSPYSSFTYSFSNYPLELLTLIESLGVNDKVAVVSIGADAPYVLYGIHFDESGRFCYSQFDNPLSTINASLYGVYSLTDLSLNGGPLYTDELIFYNKFYGSQYSDFLTSNVYAFNFDGLPYLGNNSAGFPCLRFSMMYKDSTSTVWSDSTTSYAFPGIYNWGPGGYIIPHEDYLSWSYSYATTLDPAVILGDYHQGVVDGELTEEDFIYPGVNLAPLLLESDSILSSYQNLSNQFVTGTLTLQEYDQLISLENDYETGTGLLAGSLGQFPAESFLVKLHDVIQSPIEWLMDGLLSGIKAIFIPSQDYLTAKVDALASHFPFVAPIVTLARTISLGFDVAEPEPPIIYLHLEDTRGSYNLGGTVPFIDMSWYAEYKPIGDALLSSLLWVVFIWRQFRQLPGLISGMPGEFNSRVLDVLHISLPSRSMATEVQRQRIKDSVRKEAKKK